MEPADVRGLLSAIREGGVSASGARGLRAALSAMFATAVEDGLLRSNPVNGIRIPGTHEQAEEKAKALTRAELALLLVAITISNAGLAKKRLMAS